MARRKPETTKDQISEVWDVVRGTNGDGLEVRVETIEKKLGAIDIKEQIAAGVKEGLKAKPRSPHLRKNDYINRGIQVLTLGALLFAFLGLQSEGVLRRVITAVVNDPVEATE